VRGDSNGFRVQIETLERKVAGLRLSRRVLMNLVITQEREKQVRVRRLQEENKRLKEANRRYVKTLWAKNRRIHYLEEMVRSLLNRDQEISPAK